MSTLPDARSKKNRRGRRTGRFIFAQWGDENGQASGALANNFPADAANSCFHGWLYGAMQDFGQEERRLRGCSLAIY
ncbi:hypothetical protein [Rhizobium tumorigenes]|uniref:Uncharacterized protein n=1 Tax=Rhizobium tumorigenes TaxID=2041385 RepID=A0AAF1KSU6_9HYPH|nr:hypothetical protein [Rhizobium tumorigenes]WFR96340.1 hypothetical protein PR017_04180 [Rhizobium tumorigenes]